MNFLTIIKFFGKLPHCNFTPAQLWISRCMHYQNSIWNRAIRDASGHKCERYWLFFTHQSLLDNAPNYRILEWILSSVSLSMYVVYSIIINLKDLRSTIIFWPDHLLLSIEFELNLTYLSNPLVLSSLSTKIELQIPSQTPPKSLNS